LLKQGKESSSNANLQGICWVFRVVITGVKIEDTNQKQYTIVNGKSLKLTTARWVKFSRSLNPQKRSLKTPKKRSLLTGTQFLKFDGSLEVLRIPSGGNGMQISTGDPSSALFE